MVSATLTDRPLETAVWAALEDVHDPEIPQLSVVDLGVVRRVETAPRRVRVELMPTFVGCPAVEVMRAAVAERLRDFAEEVEVELTFAEPWTSDRITEQGRHRLRQSGLAPPPMGSTDDGDLLPVLPVAECPYCGSRNSTLENAFGPTLCRAIYHCTDCRQPFEQFKLV
ncbi:MAG: phenylacetate-CoA oxygenase subunit PaaJ [Chloroflexota bacterium]|nr:phenylacetate-CoA oxygenase subunit PaaJ [Chloroflexota bacterium]